MMPWRTTCADADRALRARDCRGKRLVSLAKDGKTLPPGIKRRLVAVFILVPWRRECIAVTGPPTRGTRVGTANRHLYMPARAGRVSLAEPGPVRSV